MDVAVRVAVGDDVVRAEELLAAAMAEAATVRGAELLGTLGGPAAGRPDAAPSDAAAVVRQWTNRGVDGVILLGALDGAVVGLGAGHAAGTLGRVDCCYVEPRAREIGVGSAMLDGLLAWFAAQGCRDVDALALPGDRRSKQRFEAAGFKARLLVLHRPLD